MRAANADPLIRCLHELDDRHMHGARQVPGCKFFLAAHVEDKQRPPEVVRKAPEAGFV